MNKVLSLRTRLLLTGIVTIAIWSLLTWNYYNGGVPSHHILAREDMPQISNWWGGLLLPLLTWFLLYRIQKRIVRNAGKNAQATTPAVSIFYGFAGGLLFGMLLSLFFSLGYMEIPGYMLMGLLVLALWLPVYRAECLLGFVIGMTFTFGTVLPTGVGTILALIGVVLYLYVRTAILFIATRLGYKTSSKTHNPVPIES